MTGVQTCALPIFVLEKEWIENVRKNLPELPEAKKARYVAEYGLPEYDAGLLTSSRALAGFFEAVVVQAGAANAKATSNWIMGDMMRLLKEKNLEAEDIPFSSDYLVCMITLIDEGTISGTIARKVFERMFETGKHPETIVKEEGLEVVNDEGALSEAVKKVQKANPQSVADYKSGKEKAFGFLMGQVMRETRGKANPELVNKLLREELDKL